MVAEDGENSEGEAETGTDPVGEEEPAPRTGRSFLMSLTFHQWQPCEQPLKLFERPHLYLPYSLAANAVYLAEFLERAGLFLKTPFCQNMTFAFV